MNLKNTKAVLEKALPVESLGLFAENDRTLRIELDKASPYLPSMLAHVSLLPHYAKLTEIFISNGAYQLQSQAENQHILTTNPYYWAKEKSDISASEVSKKFPLMQICLILML